MGHGHVIPNPGGEVARCGGPALCEECRREQEQVAYLRVTNITLTPEQVVALEKAPPGPLEWIAFGPRPLSPGATAKLPALCGLGCGRPLADTTPDDGLPAPTVCAQCQGMRDVDRWGRARTNLVRGAV